MSEVKTEKKSFWRTAKKDLKSLGIMLRLMKSEMPCYVLNFILTLPLMFIGRAITGLFSYGVVDNANSGNLGGIYTTIILTFAGLAAVSLFGMLAGTLSNYLYTRAYQAVCGKMLRHIVHLKTSDYNEKHSGDLHARVNNDVDRAIGSTIWGLPWMVSQIVSIIVGGMIFYNTNKVIFFICLGVGLLQVFQSFIYVKPVRQYMQQIRRLESGQTERMSDALRGGEEVRSFSIRGWLAKRYIDAQEEVVKWQIKYHKKDTLRVFFACLRGFLSSFAIVGVGLFFYSKDAGMSVAQITLLLGMTGLFVGPFSWVSESIVRFSMGMASVDRVVEIIELADENEDFGDRVPVADGAETAIEFDGVGFAYGEEKILDNFSLSVKKDASIAFVGSSGCGKSTLLRLIMQLYRHTEGEIRVFGTRVLDCSLRGLRGQITYIAQESPLFDDTVYNNILCGDYGATQKQVYEAAKKANAHEFIEKLQDGYQTKVGERGVKLSGGQRQRITIARAILKNSPILLLDEATSALDSEAEMIVNQSLSALMEGRTVITVAHRLSTIEDRDIIYVMDKGRIVQQGRHEELLADEGGLYAEYYAHSIKGETEAADGFAEV